MIVGRTLRDDDLKINFVEADLSTMTQAAEIARSLDIEGADAIVFTNGIVPGDKRVATSEGIEMDMAASALNRHVMLKLMVRTSPQTCHNLIHTSPHTCHNLTRTLSRLYRNLNPNLNPIGSSFKTKGSCIPMGVPGIRWGYEKN